MFIPNLMRQIGKAIELYNNSIQSNTIKNSSKDFTFVKAIILPKISNMMFGKIRKKYVRIIRELELSTLFSLYKSKRWNTYRISKK